MSNKEILDQLQKLIDLLLDIKKKAELGGRVYKVLVDPDKVWAIAEVGYDVGDEFDVRFPDITLHFKRYDGKYTIYLEDLDRRVLRLDDGTEVNFEYVEDIAKIFKVMFGGVRRVILEDMLANIFTNGRDRPVGFLYDKYFAVVAPIIRENPIE